MAVRMRVGAGWIVHELGVELLPGGTGSVPLNYGISMSRGDLDAVRSATGVAPEAVSAMLLSVYDGTVLDLSPLGRGPAGGSGLRGAWGLFRGSRCCPECVTAVDGAWQLWWRLGGAAACPQHQVLLHGQCPRCRLPLRWNWGWLVLAPFPANGLGWRPAESRAHRRGQRGDPAGAARAFADIVVDQQRVLGPDNPRVLSARHYAGYWRGEAGDAAGAAAAFCALLTDRVRVLGPYHRDTLATRHNVAVWRGKAGDAAGAFAAFTELLTDQQIALGPHHPDVLLTHNYIAKWRGELGDAIGAAAAFAELLPHMMRVYGPGHPDTLAAQANLAYWRRQSGTS